MATKSRPIHIYRGELQRVKVALAATKPLYFDADWAQLKVGRLRTGQEFVHLDIGDQYLIVNSSNPVPWAGRTAKCRSVEIFSEYPYELMDERARSYAMVMAGGIEIFSGSDEDFRDFVLVSLACPRRFLVLRDERLGVPTNDVELNQLMAELEAAGEADGATKSK